MGAEQATAREIERANDEYFREGEVEIDQGALVSRCEDPSEGLWVQAWVWLGPEEDEDG